jgi:hypothetical protein
MQLIVPFMLEQAIPHQKNERDDSISLITLSTMSLYELYNKFESTNLARARFPTS